MQMPVIKFSNVIIERSQWILQGRLHSTSSALLLSNTNNATSWLFCYFCSPKNHPNFNPI